MTTSTAKETKAAAAKAKKAELAEAKKANMEAVKAAEEKVAKPVVVEAVTNEPIETPVTVVKKVKAKTIYETLESGQTSITVNKVAIDVDLPAAIKGIEDFDNLDSLRAFIEASPYTLEFLQFGIKGALRYFRADCKKKTQIKTLEAAMKWAPKPSKRVTRKATARAAKVEAWKAEGLTPEEIMDRLINE